MHETARVVLYGLVAAASPAVLLATLVVLLSGRGRVNAIAFTAAFLLGQSAAYLVGFVVGAAARLDDGSRGEVVAVLELALGALLLGAGWQRRSGRGAQLPGGTPRIQALFGRLADVKPVAAFGIGLPLGVGAKRLIITIVAATTVAAAALTRPESVALSVVYVAVASIVVWFPVALYLLFGKRADGLLADSREWVVAHEVSITVVSAFAFGLLLIGDALVALVL
jgi:Sap, sulfolipid-1-addressing protein